MNPVIFTWGNPARGDDGVGPWFADLLRRSNSPYLQLIEDFQLQVEHLLDCRCGELLLFIDAHAGSERDFLFAEVELSSDLAHTSHALTAAELLGHYQRVFHETPPAAFELSVPGSCFELGQPMTAATETRCRHAFTFLQGLLRNPEPECWRIAAC